MAVSKLPSGRWRVRVKAGGRVVADRAFDLKRDAERWEAEQKRSLALGDFVDPRRGKEPLGSAVDRWLAARAGTVSASTLLADTSLLRTHLSATIRNRPIGAVSASDIDVLLGQLTRARLARSTVTRFRASLSSFFGWAVRQHVVAKNPVTGTRTPSGLGSDDRREVYPFSIAELREVHAELAVHNERQAELLLVLGLTGLRWGELVALRPRDIVMVPRPALRVSRSAPDGQAVRTVTKGGGARVVPLPAELLPVVDRWKQGKGPNDFLFTSNAGRRLNNANWRRAVHWSEHRRGRRPHDLRHSAATFWLGSGIDPKTVQTWLGHASMTMTVDLYGHWMGSDADAAAIAKVDASLGDTSGTRSPNLRVGESS